MSDTSSDVANPFGLGVKEWIEDLGPFSRSQCLEFCDRTRDPNLFHKEPQAALAWCAAFRKQPPPGGEVVVPGFYTLEELPGRLVVKLGQGTTVVKIRNLHFAEPLYSGQKAQVFYSLNRVVAARNIYFAELRAKILVGGEPITTFEFVVSKPAAPC